MAAPSAPSRPPAGPLEAPAAQRMVIEKSAKPVVAPEVDFQTGTVKPLGKALSLLRDRMAKNGARNAARYKALHVTPLTAAYDTLMPKG